MSRALYVLGNCCAMSGIVFFLFGGLNPFNVEMVLRGIGLLLVGVYIKDISGDFERARL